MKLIIVERDGVINEARAGTVSSPDEWRPIAGSAEAIARLVHAGWHVVVLADQTALARGICDMASVSAAHGRMIATIEEAGGRVDAIFFCPPDDDAVAGDACGRTLRTVLQRLPAPVEQGMLVGDSLRELETAHRAGLRPVLVLTGTGRRTLEAGGLPDGTRVRVDLSAVASDLAC